MDKKRDIDYNHTVNMNQNPNLSPNIYKKAYKEFNFDTLYKNFDYVDRQNRNIIGGFVVYEDGITSRSNQSRTSTKPKPSPFTKNPKTPTSRSRASQNCIKQEESPVRTIENYNGLVIENIVRRKTYNPMQRNSEVEQHSTRSTFNLTPVSDARRNKIGVIKAQNRRGNSMDSNASRGGQLKRSNIKATSRLSRSGESGIEKYDNSTSQRNTGFGENDKDLRQPDALVDSQPFENLVVQNKPQEVSSKNVEWKQLEHQRYNNGVPTYNRPPTCNNAQEHKVKNPGGGQLKSNPQDLLNKYRFKECKEVKGNIQQDKVDSLNLQQLDDRNCGNNQDVVRASKKQPIVGSFGEEYFF